MKRKHQKIFDPTYTPHKKIKKTFNGPKKQILQKIFNRDSRDLVKYTNDFPDNTENLSLFFL